MLQMLLAMLLVLITWVAMAQVLIGLGLAAGRLFGLRGVTTDRALLSFWLGYCIVIAFAQIWHFAWPVAWPALVTVVVAGVLGLGWNRQAYIEWIGGAIERRRWLFGVIALGGLWMANQAIGPGNAHDSGLYHYSVIDWTGAYPVITGMGNLSVALSLNNSSLLFAALLDNGPWAGRVEHIANGQLLIVMLAMVLRAMAGLLPGRPPRERDVFPALLLAPVVMLLFSKEVCSPKTDLAQAMLIYVSAWTMVSLFSRDDFDEDDRAFRVMCLAAVCATAICLKLSAAAFAVVAGIVVLAVWLRRDRPAPRWRLRVLAWSAAWIVVLLVPWIGRNVVMNGYPLYPSAAMPVDVEWRVPEEKVVTLVEEIRNHGKGGLPLWIHQALSGTSLDWYAQLIDPPFEDRSEVRGLSWLRPWLVSLPASSAIEVVLPLAVAALAWLALAYRRIRRGAYAVVRSTISLTLLPIGAGIAFWLWSSPEPRYAYGVFWALAAISAAAATDSIAPLARARLGRIIVAGSILLCVPTVAYRAGVLRVKDKIDPLGQVPFRGPGPDHGFHPIPRPETAIGTTNWGLELHIPTGDDTQCWRGPLPCIGWPPFDPDLRLRREGDLRSGFIIDRSKGGPGPSR
jgi:hypothetical protein